jgi:uncharacterized MnhB-related membrane protein
MPNALFESFAESLNDQTYLLAIVALMPMVGGLLVFQTSPYQALVLRGILGAIAALVYALFGAADVALTEALVGTMLSMTLYVVAIFSSQKLEQSDQPVFEVSEQVSEQIHSQPLDQTLDRASDQSPSQPDLTAEQSS